MSLRIAYSFLLPQALHFIIELVTDSFEPIYFIADFSIRSRGRHKGYDYLRNSGDSIHNLGKKG